MARSEAAAAPVEWQPALYTIAYALLSGRARPADDSRPRAFQWRHAVQSNRTGGVRRQPAAAQGALRGVGSRAARAQVVPGRPSRGRRRRTRPARAYSAAARRLLAARARRRSLAPGVQPAAAQRSCRRMAATPGTSGVLRG